MLMYHNLWSKKSLFKVVNLLIPSIQFTYRRTETKSKRERGKQRAFAGGTYNSKKEEVRD